MPSPAPLARRRLLGLGLGLGAGLAVAGAGGCSGGVPDLPGVGDGAGRFERATCVPRSALDSHRDLAGLPLVYEPDQRVAAFRFDAAFHARLEGWASGLDATLASAPTELATYGSWTDGGTDCDSWHHAGRAFDLARVRLADGSQVSCRQDRWRDLDAAARDTARRRYWALAAGLHQRFAYVLTYLYDAQHANHIHLDNGRSGNADSTFSSRSRVQVQAVQALCSYLWDDPVELTGTWDDPTRAAAARVLAGLGLDADLQVSWQDLLAASAARGRD